jgi:hypothetical protein
MSVYQVIYRGNKLALFKSGNEKCTRVYRDGLEMRDDVAFYLFNRDTRVVIHNKDGTVNRTIISLKSQVKESLQ